MMYNIKSNNYPNIMDSAPNRSGNKPDVVDFSFQDFLKLCLSKWIWFVVSLVICVGIGVLYICRQQPVYERSEEILITDPRCGWRCRCKISGAFATMEFCQQYQR